MLVFPRLYSIMASWPTPGRLRMAATVPSDTDSPIGGILMVVGSQEGSVDRKPRSCVATARGNEGPKRLARWLRSGLLLAEL